MPTACPWDCYVRRYVRRQSYPLPAGQRRSRRLDRFAGMAFTHSLTRIFASGHPVVQWPRGLALSLLDAMPPVKKAFTRAMLFGMS